MTIHTFEPARYHTTLGPHEPVLHIAPGDTVITSTVDAMGQNAQGVKVIHGINPQTGPFYVEGLNRAIRLCCTWSDFFRTGILTGEEAKRKD